MALWYMVNSCRFNVPGKGAVYLRAAELIDDTKWNLPLIQAAGGVVVPNTYPGVASMAAFCQTRVRRGGLSDDDLDRLMMTAMSGDVVAIQQNRVFQSSAAGATVAAGAAIAPNVLFTPKATGKVKVMAWASIQALAAGTFTPVLEFGAGPTIVAAPAKLTGAASQTPYHLYLEHEVDGLPIGTAQTFKWVSTAGDATVTLGNGASGIASRMELQEMF